MKNISVIVCFLLLSCPVICQNTGWFIQSPPTLDNFTSISAIDEQHAWAVGRAGTIIYTEDGGTTWNLQNTFVQYNFESIHFPDPLHGCIAGWAGEVIDSTIVLITNDGGQTWAAVDHPKGNYLYDVFFINNMIGWIVGIAGEIGWILYTDDGGSSWEKQMNVIGVSGELYGVHFRDENIGNICGLSGTFLHTNSGGTSGNGWTVNISIPSLGKDLYGLYNFASANGYAVGQDGTVIVTIDNWTNWDEMPSNTDQNLNAVSGDEASNKFWAVGNAGTIIHRAGIFSIWEIQPSGVEEDLNDVDFVNENTGWAVGNNGVILKYGESGSFIPEKNITQFSVLPNPCIESFRINFCLDRTSGLEIKISNLLGQPVYVKDHIHLSAGNHSLEINVEGMGKGIYFINIGQGNSLLTKKLIIK